MRSMVRIGRMFDTKWTRLEKVYLAKDTGAPESELQPNEPYFSDPFTLENYQRHSSGGTSGWYRSTWSGYTSLPLLPVETVRINIVEDSACNLQRSLWASW